ncbi:MAG: LptF/LptG family permease [Bdellovibrionota bacterium]
MVIWRYLFFQFFKSILAVLLFALVLYFILTYMEESQHYFPGRHVTSKTIFLYYFWQLPSITILLLPFTVLIGGIVTNWILAKNGEIAALRAAGLSMVKISIPLICVGLFYSFAQFYLSEFVIPYTSTEYLKIKNNVIDRKKSDNIFSESKWLRTPSTILHYDEYEEEKQILEKPEIFVFFTTGVAKKIVQAKFAHFDENVGAWVFHYALVTNFSEDSKVTNIEVKPLFVTDIDFAPPKVLKQNSESGQLSYWKLKKLIKEAQIAGTNVSDRIVDLQLKLSGPFASLLFVFLTLPFALRKERQEENYIGIVLCLAVALVYWFGNLSLRNLAIKGIINPIVAAWFMNIFIGVLSFILVRKLDKGQ